MSFLLKIERKCQRANHDVQKTQRQYNCEARSEIFEWYLTDCQQTNAYQLTLEENKEEYFEYQASLTHLDESELPGSRTVPHPAWQSQGICFETKKQEI